jgi:hypothetical protein
MKSTRAQRGLRSKELTDAQYIAWQENYQLMQITSSIENIRHLRDTVAAKSLRYVYSEALAALIILQRAVKYKQEIRMKAKELDEDLASLATDELYEELSK